MLEDVNRVWENTEENIGRLIRMVELFVADSSDMAEEDIKKHIYALDICMATVLKSHLMLQMVNCDENRRRLSDDDAKRLSLVAEMARREYVEFRSNYIGEDE